MAVAWIKKFFETGSEEKGTSGNTELLNELHGRVLEQFPQVQEEKAIILTCLAGLLARVAYRDMEIDQGEKEFMAKALSDWCHLEPETATKVSQLALDDIQALAGADNYLYAYPLESLFSEEQKFDLLKALFSMAAADGSVENLESEEIRTISQRLSLSHQHFIAARATVVEALKALRS